MSDHSRGGGFHSLSTYYTLGTALGTFPQVSLQAVLIDFIGGDSISRDPESRSIGLFSLFPSKIFLEVPRELFSFLLLKVTAAIKSSLESGRYKLKFQLSHLLVMEPLCLSFLIYNMGIILIIPTVWVI